MEAKKLILVIAMCLSFTVIGETSKVSGSEINKDSMETKINVPLSNPTIVSEEKMSLKKQRKVIRPTTTWSKIKDLFM
ncbi:MAG: hypothetical protein N2053_10945 [Chitinispirillaceae bacterium]|nr:hypothetical protein [Chitinispirillaceae bacterium]